MLVRQNDDSCRGALTTVCHASDELRLAVKDALCRTEKRRDNFKEALFSLEHGEQTDLEQYVTHLIALLCIA